MNYSKLFFLSLSFVLLLVSACGDDDDNNNPTIGTETYTIWSGPTITFEKANGVDPELPENQDRITDNVWITRNNGGQIFNIVEETEADKDLSPKGTLWAQGTTAELDDLDFTPFREAIRPQDSPGVDLVMVLVEDQIAIDVKFLSWSGNQMGGFSYQRATE